MLWKLVKNFEIISSRRYVLILISQKDFTSGIHIALSQPSCLIKILDILGINAKVKSSKKTEKKLFSTDGVY